MILEFGYGKTIQTVDVPDRNLLAVLHANPVPPGITGEAEVRRALEEPIGTPRLRDLVKPGRKIAIVTSDISRPMPTAAVMPALLDELYTAGVSPDDVTLVFALGSHRPHTEEERRALAGERASREIRLTDSDPDDVVRLGVTSAGTPVDITRVVAEADFRIALGNVEFHYFAGYSGGAKAIMPGVSTPEAIQANHRMMVRPEACAGRLIGNPIRADIEEAERFCHADFILNVVLDEHKRIVRAVAGDVTLAHREGCRFLDRMYRCPIPKKADIVLVSQGGWPKDANLYQTQKALDNAKYALAPGGTMIVIGACSEGFGSAVFEEWMCSAPTSHSLIDRIGREFRLGGHKAAAIAMVLEESRIDLVSEMDPALVRSIFLNPQPTAETAFREALARHGENATVIAMPYGGSTLPVAE